jgi:diguanylate cyclase (GGDEF)-like protein
MIAEIRNRQDSNAEDSIDPTTRLRRISYLATVGPQLLASAGKDRSPVSLIYLEIRHLHRIFRTYGADAGNSILRGIADCIKPELRDSDILIRYENRAFIAFLPGVREDQAIHCSQRLKQRIKMQHFSLGGRSLAVDCIAGLSSYPKGGTTIFALIQSAQQSIGSKTSKAGAGNKVIGFNLRF